MNPVSTPAAEAPRKLESFLLDVSDAMNTTLDLDTLLKRIAELVRQVIDFEHFGILLVQEKTQELRLRFHIGHDVGRIEKLRLRVGVGVTGKAVERREAILVDDVDQVDFYLEGHEGVRSELAVPLIAKDKVIGVVDLQSSRPHAFTEEHKRMLVLLASRIAAGIENARLYTRVARQARTLELLNEISRELTGILHLDTLMQRIADHCRRVVEYHMFSILLADEAGTKLRHRFSVRFNEKVQIKTEIAFGDGLVGYSAQHKQAVVVPDVKKDPRYIEINPETRSELVVPLIHQDKVIGVLDLEHTKRGYYNETHARTMTTLAAQLAIAIQNARLYERVQKEEQRLERDLATARELQFRLLPAGCPALKNAEIAARYEPAHAIGGDLYDFLDYSLDRVGIAIGDVSGKGASAALYAALVSGLLRSTAASEPAAAEMLSAVNLSLRERGIDAQFVSLIYGIWDDHERVLQVANSGLPRPIHCRDGQTMTVQATGLPLGLFDDAEFEEVTLQTEPGDVIIFYSDGVTDARNQYGGLFGRERLEKVVAASCHGSAGDIVQAIFDATCEECLDMPQFDDKTVVAIKVR
ncbi:MAG TPA: GAF domain-containing protein [Terriglobales bacterium]|nr:GAF domain-containing protein [Terriglobales bacterium]